MVRPIFKVGLFSGVKDYVVAHDLIPEIIITTITLQVANT